MSTSSNPALSMITLCNISYNLKDFIVDEVNNFDPSLQVVWGPVECFIPHALESVALMYIVKGAIVSDGSDAEYTVVIRGTNFTSWTSWKNEDFALSPPVLFNTLVPDAPATAVISTGANNGISYLNRLSYPVSLTQSFTAVGFFQNIGADNIAYLNVAGHSLGGGLVPPYFAYLCYSIFSGPMPAGTVCTPFSFAGPTTGNAGFCTFFQSYIPSGLNWRYVNPLDIAPNCWWSIDNIATIYNNKPKWADDDKKDVKKLFSQVPAAPDNYVQPDGGEVTLPSVIDHSHLDSHLWIAQVLHQHHSGTYMMLVETLT